MSNYRKIRFVVEVEQQTVDGCGNEVKPITEGIVRQAIERLDSVHSVNVGKPNKYIWMVAVDGYYDGTYQHPAYLKLFPDRKSAVKYVNDELRNLVVNGPLMGTNYSDEDLEQEVKDHTEWSGYDDVNYHDCGTEFNYSISKVALSEME